MEGSYGVCFGNRQVGKVTVQRKGLYYRFQCRCRLPENGVSRLRISCGKVQENLGVLTPEGDGFCLDTKLPVKRFGEEIPVFTVVPKSERAEGTYVPVYPEEPFSYISELKRAYLVRKNGGLGIVLK